VFIGETTASRNNPVSAFIMASKWATSPAIAEVPAQPFHGGSIERLDQVFPELPQCG
jgi:hypothetical protein